MNFHEITAWIKDHKVIVLVAGVALVGAIAYTYLHKSSATATTSGPSSSDSDTTGQDLSDGTTTGSGYDSSGGDWGDSGGSGGTTVTVGPVSVANPAAPTKKPVKTTPTKGKTGPVKLRGSGQYGSGIYSRGTGNNVSSGDYDYIAPSKVGSVHGIVYYEPTKGVFDKVTSKSKLAPGTPEYTKAAAKKAASHK
jgi:hypothetical protein